jgi:hypothetical protein
MQSVKGIGSRTSVAALVLAALGTMSTTEVLGREQLAQLAPQVEYRLMGAEWEGELPEEPLKVALLEWIGANSEYDVSGTLANPPTVKFCAHGSTLVYKGRAIHFDDRLNGVYDETTKQICLAKPWHPSSVKDRGILLHELVHHVQHESGRWPCPKATEWEAYKLQEAWLLENGTTPDFNWAFILLDSSCTPRDIHP